MEGGVFSGDFLRETLPYLLSGLDSQSEPCQRFFRDGLYSSFVKILTDEAVYSWEAEIQVWDFLRICNSYV